MVPVPSQSPKPAQPWSAYVCPGSAGTLDGRAPLLECACHSAHDLRPKLRAYCVLDLRITGGEAGAPEHDFDIKPEMIEAGVDELRCRYLDLEDGDISPSSRSR